MGQNGGARPGAGRKSKADELKLIEKLSVYDDNALALLFEGIDNKDKACLKLFMEYRYGKPKQQIDHTTDGESLNAVPDLSKFTFDELKQLIGSNNTGSPEGDSKT